MCLFLSAVGAQTVTGSLVGHVQDANGGAIPGARVVVTDVDRSTRREVVTNEEGNFSINSIDPGVYRLEIEQANFKKAVRERVEVAINTTVRADVDLEPGGVTETVEGSGEAAQLKRIAPMSASRSPESRSKNCRSPPTAITRASSTSRPA